MTHPTLPSYRSAIARLERPPQHNRTVAAWLLTAAAVFAFLQLIWT